MNELPLVWRKAGDPLYTAGISDERYKYDTDLFYGYVHNDTLLGWAKREFAKGYVVILSWRVADDADAEELGRTRTLAEAKELLEGYVYAWWLTPEAQEMKDGLRRNHEEYLQRMSRQQRAASTASARILNMPTVRGEGSV
jgi:hypothetical protein